MGFCEKPYFRFAQKSCENRDNFHVHRSFETLQASDLMLGGL